MESSRFDYEVSFNFTNKDEVEKLVDGMRQVEASVGKAQEKMAALTAEASKMGEAALNSTTQLAEGAERAQEKIAAVTAET